MMSRCVIQHVKLEILLKSIKVRKRVEIMESIQAQHKQPVKDALASP